MTANGEGNPKDVGYAIFGADQHVATRLLERVDGLLEVCGELVTALPVLTDRIHRVGHPAMSAAGNQVVNDALDLIHDCILGRGRAALRSARSLFELLITLHDVTTDEAVARRYVEHRAVLARLAGDLDLVEKGLKGKDRKAEAHRRRKILRDTQEDFDRALSRYGAGYIRGWARADLFARSSHYGLDGYYAFYRLASGVLHGSSGGVLGHHRTIDGLPVHRVGPALELVPVALLYGLEFFDRSLIVIGGKLGDDAVFEVRSVLSKFRALWPQLRKSLLEIDRDMWPDHPPSHHAAVLVWFPDGALRWYLWDPSLAAMREGQAPSLDSKMQERLDLLVERIKSESPAGPITVEVKELVLAAAPGSEWFPDTDLMVAEPPEGWESLEINPYNPRVIDL